MGVKSDFNPDVLMANIRQVGEKAIRGVSDIMVEEGENMQELAKQYAPRQEDHNGSHLEDAIKLRVDRSGKNRRIEVDIYVDTEMVGKNGKSIDEYAVMMEEGLAPYGSGAFNLGEESQAKAAAGNDVGGKYMARAFKKRATETWRRANALVKRMLA